MIQGYGKRGNNMYYIAHHGIRGMKWGVRRYQNEDGSLTDAGKKRYIRDSGRLTKLNESYKRKQIKANKAYQKADRKRYGMFGSQKRAQPYYDRANEMQYKANKKIRKGAKLYKKMGKYISETQMKDLNPELIALGKSMFDQIQNTSRITYGSRR